MQLTKIKIPKKHQTIHQILEYLTKNYKLFDMLFSLDENKNLVIAYDNDGTKYVPIAGFKR